MAAWNLCLSALTVTVIVLGPVRYANASKSDFEIYRSLIKAEQLDEAERVIKKLIESTKEVELRSLANFALGVQLQKQKKHEEAIANFDQALAGKTDLEDFIRIHKGQSLRALEKYKEAKEEFVKAEALPDKSTRAFYEAEFELGEIEMIEKKWPAASAHFSKLERKLRSDEKYPYILFNLVRVENAKGKKYKSCRWARKLYSKWPHHPLVSQWSVDLQNVIVDEKPLQCVANLNDQRQRIRNLQLQGLSQKAQAEIDVLKSRAIESTMSHLAFLSAQFLASEGRTDEALKVLQGYDKRDGSKNFSFYALMGRVAAQAGQFQLAVEAYEKAHRLAPRSRAGRTALFQAAFLSYQFQDYPGASSKFGEFIKKYPRSGLSSDAKWHLAWIHYLKGEYAEAYDGFKVLWKTKTKKRRTLANEKTLYWTAMSLVKLGRHSEALPIFEQLSQDKSYGYYSLASKARLNLLQSSLNLRQVASASEKNETSISENADEAASKEEAENEDDEKTLLSVDDDEEAAETKDEEEIQMIKAESPFQNVKLARRFKRANDLISIGLNNWATWELFEIERRTAQQKHLKTLIASYESIEAFNRSSFISIIYFPRQRAQAGFRDKNAKDVLPLWYSAYPRAFERSVSNFSRSFNVQEEFVWAIMRTESQFKADVKSPVGALGLMQLMPYTATQIAKLLKFNEFTPPQLFEPATNIRLGSRYLQRLMKQFEQTLPLAAAAYNAGPHRVRSWLKIFGEKLDMDEFVEHIPYLETRNYVKKVVHNYYIYRQLYNKSAKSDELLSWLAQPVGVKVTGDVESREVWN